MDAKRLAAAARIAVGVGLATLTGGTGQVNAAPLDPPPPSPTSQPDPGQPPGIPAKKCWEGGRQGPEVRRAAVGCRYTRRSAPQPNRRRADRSELSLAARQGASALPSVVETSRSARRCGVSFGVFWVAASQHVERIKPQTGTPRWGRRPECRRGSICDGDEYLCARVQCSSGGHIPTTSSRQCSRDQPPLAEKAGQRILAVDSTLVTSKNPAMLLLSPRSELSNTAGVGVPFSTGGPKLRTHDMDQHDECDRRAATRLIPARALSRQHRVGGQKRRRRKGIHDSVARREGVRRPRARNTASASPWSAAPAPETGWPTADRSPRRPWRPEGATEYFVGHPDVSRVLVIGGSGIAQATASPA